MKRVYLNKKDRNIKPFTLKYQLLSKNYITISKQQEWNDINCDYIPAALTNREYFSDHHEIKY